MKTRCSKEIAQGQRFDDGPQNQQVVTKSMYFSPIISKLNKFGPPQKLGCYQIIYKFVWLKLLEMTLLIF